MVLQGPSRMWINGFGTLVGEEIPQDQRKSPLNIIYRSRSMIHTSNNDPHRKTGKVTCLDPLCTIYVSVYICVNVYVCIHEFVHVYMYADMYIDA